MQEELKSALVEVIETATSAKDFVISEIPEVVNQLLVWEATVSVIQFLLFLTFFSMYVFSLYKCYRKDGLFNKWREKTDPWNEVWPWVLSTLATFLLPLTFGWLFNLDWLKIWLAPKIYLIEYVSELIK